MTLWQNLRYGLRTLRKSPGFATVAVLCLALGIGANTAIFSLIDAALLRMLPVAQPERLVTVRSASADGDARMSFSYPQYQYLSAHASELSGVLAYANIALNLSTGAVTDAPAGQLVSNNFFSVLGVPAAVGRSLVEGDEAAAVLSYRYWRSRFHADSAVVGSTVSLNGLAFTVAGVAPPRFFGVEVGNSPDVWVPLAMCDRLSPGPPRLPLPNNFWLDLMARLQPGVGVARASAEMEILYHQGLIEQAPTMRPALQAMLQKRHIKLGAGDKGRGGLGGQFGTPLLILMMVVALVLLIACANVANLLLARASARRRERSRFALRWAPAARACCGSS
ncbi:conserved exported hypothetical protein [Candidatus Sulfopaludibacter sp. SbA4]|nr:conserved exported hypothetical protein [Candidatus Sulfopaludibacter sp. SbA4]